MKRFSPSIPKTINLNSLVLHSKRRIINGDLTIIYDFDFKNNRNRKSLFVVICKPTGFIFYGAYIPENMQRQGLTTNFLMIMNQYSIINTKKPIEISSDLSDDGKKFVEAMENKKIISNYICVI